jgi:hypothetical protein
VRGEKGSARVSAGKQTRALLGPEAIVLRRLGHHTSTKNVGLTP